MAYTEYLAKYPAQKASVSDLLKPNKEAVSTTLAAAVTPSSPGEGGSLRVASATDFSSSGGVVRVNDAEIMVYSGKGSDATSDYLTVAYRAVPGGGSAASASIGDTVEEVVAREYVARLIAEVVAIEAELGTSPSGSASDVTARIGAEHAADGTHTSIASSDFEINSGAGDVNVTLTLARTTGGSLVLTWDGTKGAINKPLKPTDILINRIGTTAPATTFAGQMWLDTS